MTGVNETAQESSPHGATDSEQAPETATTYDVRDAKQRRVAIKHAQQALAADECVVMPTDTVYGIAANAFSATGVQRLLETKGRNRTMPPPVLIAHAGVLDGLADQVSEEARALAEAFWPGGLTLICHAQPSLQWDLGETSGTVALRVPDDEVATELLGQTGPLAVSSANRTGLPAAGSAEEARGMLGDKVQVYLDAGHRGTVAEGLHPVASTIVDCTGSTPVVVRDGAVSLTQLRSVVPSVIGVDGQAPADSAPEDSGDRDTDDAAGTGASEAGETSAEDVPEGDTLVHPRPEPVEAEGDKTSANALPEDTTPEDAPSGHETPAEPTERQEAHSTRPAPSSPARDAAAALVAGAGQAVGARSGEGLPDQDRTRPRPAQAKDGVVQPLDRATAAAIVASGVTDEHPGPEGTDQARS